MSTAQPRVSVTGKRPDALDDPIRMAMIAPFLTKGVEMASGKLLEENAIGPFHDIALSAARRFVLQAIQVAGAPESIEPVA